MVSLLPAALVREKLKNNLSNFLVWQGSLGNRGFMADSLLLIDVNARAFLLRKGHGI